MDHEAYENQMIDTVNRHAEKNQHNTPESTDPSEKKLFTKADAANLFRGFKRVVIALFTAALFGLSIFGFVMVAVVSGYWAVLFFIASIMLMISAFTLLYAQGVIHTGSQGDGK
jgi:hypothetical protein